MSFHHGHTKETHSRDLTYVEVYNDGSVCRLTWEKLVPGWLRHAEILKKAQYAPYNDEHFLVTRRIYDDGCEEILRVDPLAK